LRESFCFFLAVKSKCSWNSDIFADSSLVENFLVLNFAKKFTAIWRNSIKAYCNPLPQTTTHPFDLLWINTTSGTGYFFLVP